LASALHRSLIITILAGLPHACELVRILDISFDPDLIRDVRVRRPIDGNADLLRRQAISLRKLNMIHPDIVAKAGGGLLLRLLQRDGGLIELRDDIVVRDQTVNGGLDVVRVLTQSRIFKCRIG
jgi:hypothetical protein